MDTSLKQAVGSAITEKVVLYDEKRDAAYCGLAAQVHVHLKHFNEGKAAMAKQVNVVLRKYGNPTRLPYLEENGVLSNLIQDLSEHPLRAALEGLAISDWVMELKVNHNKFMDCFNNRNHEQSTVSNGLSKQARIQTETAYTACITRLNALVELNGVEPYAQTVNEMNRIIEYQKTVLSARDGRKDANAKKTQDGL